MEILLYRLEKRSFHKHNIIHIQCRNVFQLILINIKALAIARRICLKIRNNCDVLFPQDFLEHMLNAKAEKSITDIRTPEAGTISNFHLCSTFLSRHLSSGSHYSVVLAITFYLCILPPLCPQHQTTLNYIPLPPTTPPTFSPSNFPKNSNLTAVSYGQTRCATSAVFWATIVYSTIYCSLFDTVVICLCQFEMIMAIEDYSILPLMAVVCPSDTP